VKRYDPIPLVQRGGSQPYSTQGGRHPGAALLAMLQGSTAGGINPMDSWRQMQKSETRQKRPMTLLDMLQR
jgi:hypothetical protein